MEVSQLHWLPFALLRQLLAEYVKEQGKLLKEREVLQNRKEGLLRSLAGATFADSMIPGQQMTVMATVLSAPSLAAAQDMTRQPAGAVWAVEGSAVFAKPQARSAEAESTVEVKPETDAAAEPAELELLQQPQQLQSEAASNTAFSQPRMKPVEEFFSLRAAFVANTPESKVDLVPCSGDAAAGVGAKSDTEQIKVMSPSYGSLDGSSVLPESETMGQERTEAMQINMPEELMARDLLERLGPEITFEIRQQSEGIGGRLRVREHWCSAVYFAKGEAVQEQSYVIEGCAPGRPYTFSLRARVPCPGGVQFSEFSDHVIASVPGGKNVASLCSTEASVEIKGEGTLQEMVTAPTTLAQDSHARAQVFQALKPAVQMLREQAAVKPEVHFVQEQVQSPVKREVQVAEQVQSPLKPEVQVVEQVQSPVKREVQVVEQVQSPLKPEVQVVEQVQSPLKRDVQPEMQVAEQAPLMPEVRAVQEQAAKPGSTAEEEPNAQRGPDFGLGLEVVQAAFALTEEHQQSQELNHFRPELPNGRQVNEVQNDGANDQSFLRQWLQKRQAPSSYTGPPLQSRLPDRRTPVDLEVTRLPETDVTWLAPSRELTRGEVYRAEEASIRLAVPSGGEQFRSTQAVPSFPAQEFRPSSYMPLSAQGDSRTALRKMDRSFFDGLGPTGAVLGSIRSKSFGGVERRQTMAAKPEPRHGDLSPGDSLRLMAPLTPGGHGLVAPLAEHLQHQGFGGGTPVSKPDPLTMANALTTINSLPQGGWQQSSQHGSHQLQADAFQRPHALSQRQALGGLPNPATDFFSPLNNNLFGASALGSTRPFSLGGPVHRAPGPPRGRSGRSIVEERWRTMARTRRQRMKRHATC
eukprot:g29725.t1